MANLETIEKIEALLQSYERFGVHLGLEASLKLLTDLGNPQDRVPVIHVAGSNGKGSVCAYLSTILTEAGYKTGRYTSPHLIDWTERICINNQSIDAESLYQTLLKVHSKVDPTCSPTQFEVLTAAMWLYFAEQNVEVAVIEVGLGGRLDATNAIEHPLVSVIVSISREHWQRLGFTLSSIAGEKAGILKSGCPAVIGQLPSEAKTVIDRRIADLNCPAVYPEPSQLIKGWAHQGSLKYQLPLQGAIQLHNSALAIAAIQFLRQQNWDIPDNAIINGIRNTTWAGRLQWYNWKNHKILIDGAHNPASAEALRQYIAQIGKSPIQWVMGMLSTKDHADIFKALLRSQDSLFLVPVPDHSSADPTELAILAQEICPSLRTCQTYPDVSTALQSAIGQSKLTVLCGSLYLIGDFFKQQRHS
ncbi:MAG: bifunctional folylpolyglutamate synthase/dihydrofolate synthase [Plectolyngbya sp. WJT66-NPBG17]|jgi:dihydrofolate synthase/folylpolyglutamate synthase|nr:bifunctional folylpolyglutamate synthase/dihydrofolate synthase [Plectolyngbya sp. WJT66-NPBG17]MBW4528125.1 bifunctional folylpolyglutamate synthase/dihydrofolate synthase [Phormidium tanganyikae FI6-MK23]